MSIHGSVVWFYKLKFPVSTMELQRQTIATATATVLSIGFEYGTYTALKHSSTRTQNVRK
jgi:hypothetical protein